MISYSFVVSSDIQCWLRTPGSVAAIKERWGRCKDDFPFIAVDYN